MARPAARDRQFEEDTQIWEDLKQAITSSSGFQRWQSERLTDDDQPQPSLDHQVRRYLRETLETLAY